MKTILIVDDAFEQREVLSLCFGEDFKVRVAESGIGAAKLLQTENVDLIISDLEMPNGDGFWLLHYLKATLDRSIPVIIVSGHPSISGQEILEAGACLFFPKPYDFFKLQDAVEEILKANSLQII
jgi:DNA-binding NtrC family response regulator